MPVAIPVVRPIVAIVTALLVQLPPPPSVNRPVAPIHISVGPDIGEGNGSTVTVVTAIHP